MNAMTFTERAATLQAAYQALLETEPKLRARERAARLNVSEAELVAAQCGVAATPLAGTPQEIFRELPTLGQVMVLSRNDWCVHERHGEYEQVDAEKSIGLVLGKDLDLRMFFAMWKTQFAVIEGERRSVQFFDGAGVAIHKVYLTEHSHIAAFDAIITKFAAAEPAWPHIAAYPVDETPTQASDAAALREAWLALTDTHGFFPMLRKHKVSRLGALQAAGDDLAQSVAIDATETMLQAAAASELAIMCFVGNRGIVQIHSGPVQKLLRTGPWYNVLDPKFNLHLNTEAIASCWVVNKPTSDGWVTSLEVYAADGELIVQFFGVRKPGVPELPEWRALMESLCSTPLAK
ncbi:MULTISPECIES: hemin-degrading factor [Deefgea]|uniref:Hemin-degrading factor n=1 Tax=Deefgea chitinilytica TaxID=570276 RepID=A0ABS2CCZ5_9NEIS|nr:MULTISPECIES: ChuX/HutX family heme-like substrate-binding protein [Deefgea]MBM5572011.1 hemin-degrading factor [Deefgea chitinilytica]MBM9889246.1 hemin-degrading factor [Deefgea sp. CFH1-16]